MDENLLFLAKRLADVSKELDNLTEEEKQYIIERAEKLSPITIIELYNSLGQYGKL